MGSPTVFSVSLRRLRYVAASAIIACLTAPHSAGAARWSAPFGRVAFCDLDFAPAALSVHRKSAGRSIEIAVLAQNESTLHLYTVTDSGQVVPSGYAPLGAKYNLVRQADVDADGSTEYVFLDSEQPSMAIGRRRSGRLELTRYPVKSGIPQGVEVADITGDGRQDVLVFGKSMTGIGVFAGRGRGEFETLPFLFPDLSVADARATDFDSDGLRDIVVSDWLANRILFYRGIDGTQFSDPMEVSAAGEPGMIAAGPSRNGRVDRFAVTMVDRNEIAQLGRDASGNFANLSTVSTHGKPNSVRLIDVNRDGADEVVYATEEGIEVASIRSPAVSSRLAVYGIATDHDGWQIGDIDGDVYPDLVAVDRNARRLVVCANASSRLVTRWPMTFLTGIRPTGITLADLDRNGLLDLVVANEGSATVSIHANAAGRGFGQSASLRVPERPQQAVALPSGGHGPLSVVASHKKTDRISVSSFNGSYGTVALAEIPTCTAPVLAYAYRDKPTGLLGIVAQCTEGGARNTMLVVFEERASGQFVERKLPLSQPGKVVSIAAHATPEHPTAQLLVAGTRGGTTTLSFLGIPSGEAKELAVLPFPVTAAGIGDLDRDRNPDVVVVGGKSGDVTCVLMGLPGGGLKDSVVDLPDFRTRGSTLTVTDVNGDRCSDVVTVDPKSGDVVVLYGNAQRRFPAVTVYKARANATFAVGQLGGKSIKDLVFLDPSRNTVTIILDPFTK